MELRDGSFRRAAWLLPHAAARVAGRGAARITAQAVGRLEGLSGAGVSRVATRISPRLAGRNPGLVKIPPEWAACVDVRREGLRLALDLRDNLQAILYYAGRYEPAMRDFLHRELRAGDVVMDVGANIGLHTLTAVRRLRGLGGGRVIAFEPADDCVRKLVATAAANGLAGSDVLEVVPVALGDRAEVADLRADSRYDVADAGVRSLSGDGEIVQQVPVVRLDDWAAEHGLDRLDVVKLDVEGAEHAALSGGRRTLTRLKPRVVPVEDKRAEGRRELHDLLAALGYHPTGQVLDHNALFRR
ncbi:FkbM family methyltransferase [Kribbella sp. NBC_01245]|uniref:FkbM family methyltransferase n=1 Tax=Kribbella sp. NBC_01245 TaxID=2903578 RepID=UPI002E29FB0D|nr:FkbM family methyltransferase [Kribbella sp. NBC_01245]